MTNLAILLFVLALLLAASQVAMFGRLIRALRSVGRTTSPPAELPRAAVILCVRGPDPFLKHCLEAALAQDYPDYQLHVIVDSPHDPARALVDTATEPFSADRVQVHTLTEPRSTCSLKCSALVQVLTELDDSFEVVALLDADTLPYATWLRDLVAPLSGPGVGAATGNRWYLPPAGRFGSLVRYTWNAAAVAQMHAYGIAWGGSLALRRETIERAGLLDKWGRAFCEDTMLARQLGEHGLRVAFVPSVMLANREECDLGSFFRWMRRQLLTARLYHSHWRSVLLHGLSATVVMLASTLLLLAAPAVGNHEAFQWSGLAVALYAAVMVAVFVATEAAVHRVLRARGEETSWFRRQFLLPFSLALVVAQYSYALALVSVLRLKKVDWRGVEYRLEGPWDIRLVEYQPYTNATDAPGDASL